MLLSVATLVVCSGALAAAITYVSLTIRTLVKLLWCLCRVVVKTARVTYTSSILLILACVRYYGHYERVLPAHTGVNCSTMIAVSLTMPAGRIALARKFWYSTAGSNTRKEVLLQHVAL